MSPYGGSQGISLRIWTCAAFGAVALHVGVAALASKYLREDDSEELGAPAIEIGLEFLSPHVERADLPPGPDVEASLPTPPVMEQTQLIDPPVLPRDIPIETEDPDRVAAPLETEKPKIDEPTTPTIPALPSVASLAAEATAPPTSEIIEKSTRSITPAQGTGESPDRVRATWQKDLIAHINRHKLYPVRHSLAGANILVTFVLDETGHVLSSRIVEGSGDSSFDEAALSMIQRSDPVPKPPALIVQGGLEFTLPVVFKANSGR
jgi:protein TonB